MRDPDDLGALNDDDPRVRAWSGWGEGDPDAPATLGAPRPRRPEAEWRHAERARDRRATVEWLVDHPEAWPGPTERPAARPRGTSSTPPSPSGPSPPFPWRRAAAAYALAAASVPFGAGLGGPGWLVTLAAVVGAIVWVVRLSARQERSYTPSSPTPPPDLDAADVDEVGTEEVPRCGVCGAPKVDPTEPCHWCHT